MNRKASMAWFLLLALAVFTGCSSQQSTKETKKSGTPLHKIQGKAELAPESTASDAALNAGGPTVFLRDGLRRYRLFMKSPIQVNAGKEYVAEGVYAQKAIDEMGDPDNGKKGYPLAQSCQRVVKMAWSGLSFDVTDGHASILRTVVNRYPARPIFLVTRLDPVTPKEGADSKEGKKEAEEKELPEVSVPAEKQRAFLIEGPTVLPAPLWDSAGGAASCKVVIDDEGKISELETGKQLCEIVPWSQYRYQKPVQGGHPVKVKTEVAVRFEPRK